MLFNKSARMALCCAVLAFGCSKQEVPVVEAKTECNRTTFAGCTEQEIAGIKMGTGSLSDSGIKLNFSASGASKSSKQEK